MDRKLLQLASGPVYPLTTAAAAQIEGEVRAAFEDWASIARTCGIQRREIERLEAVLDPTIDE